MFTNYKNKYLKYKKKYLNINKTVKPIEIKLKYFNGGSSISNLSNDSFLASRCYAVAEEIININIKIFYKSKIKIFSFPFYVNSDTPESIALELVNLYDPCGTQLNLCKITTDIHNYIQHVRPGFVYFNQKEQTEQKEQKEKEQKEKEQKEKEQREKEQREKEQREKEETKLKKITILDRQCVFYKEFGKCSKGENCIFKH